MAVWGFDTDTEFTEFYFPIKEDKIYFHELVKNYFEETKSVLDKWRLLYMLRGEPLKHPDFFEIDGTDIIAISQKAVNSLNSYLNNKIELLPIETDAGKYYAINVLNIVDCLSQEKSVYIATINGHIVSYSLLEFNEEKLENYSFFKIPEMPYKIFISDDIQERCEDDYLCGLSFDLESNLVWYPE